GTQENEQYPSRVPGGGCKIWDDAAPATAAPGVRAPLGCGPGVCAGAITQKRPARSPPPPHPTLSRGGERAFQDTGWRTAPGSVEERPVADAARAAGQAHARGGAGVPRRLERDLQRDSRRGGGGLMLRRLQPAAEEGPRV